MSNSYPQRDSPKSPQNFLLFSLVPMGHYPNYIQYLIQYWCEHQLQDHLYILVVQEFIDKHTDLINLAKTCEQNNIYFVSLKPEEEAMLKPNTSKINQFIRDFQEWNLMCQYIRSLAITNCLMMIVDRYLLSMIFGMKPTCPVSGIYYRFSLHYRQLENYQPSWRENLQYFREKLTFSQVLKNPSLKSLFFLDPFAVNAINQSWNFKKAVYMPDPVKHYRSSELNLEKLKQKVNIQSGRKIFLLLGSIGERRGIYQLLDAIALLPDSLCEKLGLLLVGKIVDSDRELVKGKIAAISQSKPVQIVTHFEFISELEVHGYFHLSDVILSPHQKHIGMSGTLVLAAATQKPVLSSNYGLMGEMVKRYGLGLAVNSTVAAEIAKGLTRFIIEPETVLCDRAKMKQFAEENSTEKFAQVIFNNL
ncbi:MAG: glycosyltransferase [Lyngbya sp.]|nr:glycosyltransferase [Lyngbya sp.]